MHHDAMNSENLPDLPERRRFLGRSVGFLTLLGSGVGVRGLWYEPRHAVVEEQLIVSPKLPAGVEVRLGQLSDLHIQTVNRYHREVAAQVNALGVDAVLLTGDYLEEKRNLAGVVRFLQLLHAPQGVYGVQGNWEYWSRLEGENLRRRFAAAGVTLLINERIDLAVTGIPLSLAGLDYPSLADSLKRLQAQIDPQRLNLLLSHVPAFDHHLLDKRWDLILCGHTHGGQVRLPALPPLHLPMYSGDFVAGNYRVGAHATPLYVNRGIGTSGLPVRFFCPPEITLIRLVGADAERSKFAV
ncbi:MAG: metallophosphoesterase [Desulfuromonadales bacterium]|nr:metallophosphoesterase [Desulfuromonadales bacterium]